MDASEIEDPTMQKQRNYFRLANLILELGTEVIRNVILNNLKNDETLESLLGNDGIRSQLHQLHKNRTIDDRQWDILYPLGGDGNVDLMQIDITLWLILMHNLILKSKPGRRFIWVKDILAVKNVRNQLFHLPKPELDDLAFDRLWNKATMAISNLDSRRGQDCFNCYRNMQIDAERMVHFQRRITEQVLQEKTIRLHRENGHLRFLMKSLVFVFILIVIALVLSAFLTVYFLRQSKPCNKYRFSNSTNKGMIRFVSRRGWEASPPRDDMTPLQKPATLVIYTHTADTEACQVSEECCATVNHIQYAHMHREHDPWADIAFHFLIDSSGIIYEGRSTDFRPSAAKHWNNETISIAVIGNYMYERNIQGSTIGAFSILLDWLVQSKILSTDYTMYGMCEVRPTDSPGVHLYNYINQDRLDFPRVKQRNDTYCYFNNSFISECNEY